MGAVVENETEINEDAILHYLTYTYGYGYIAERADEGIHI